MIEDEADKLARESSPDPERVVGWRVMSSAPCEIRGVSSPANCRGFRPLGSKPPLCTSTERGASPVDLPRALVFRLPREGLLRALHEVVLESAPNITSAGKPDANFLLEIKHGLNDAQQKFHAEWRGQSTIRPPINGKARSVKIGLL